MASQENQSPAADKEKQKKVLAGVLFALLGVVFYFSDPFGWRASSSTPGDVGAKTLISPTPKTSPTPKAGANDPNRVIDEQLPSTPSEPETSPAQS